MKKHKNIKILLIFPPSTVYARDPTIPVVTPPLGLMYIASYLNKYGYKVAILDAVAKAGRPVNINKDKVLYGLSDNKIYQAIKKIKPKIIGISCMYTAYAGDAHRVAKIAKKYNRNILVVFGGAHASIFPNLILKDRNIDLVVAGEGEETFLDIVRKLEHKEKMTDIAGTYIRINNKIIKNNSRKYIINLDNIPFASLSPLSLKRYLKKSNSLFSMRQPSMVMITSRGCPGHCIYCSIHAVWRHFWRGRSPANVVDEIELLVSKYGIKEFYFMDDSMGIFRLRLHKICQEIINRKLDIRWTVPNGIAHWTLDEKTLDLMKKSGCYRITFGIESGNKKLRKIIGKPYPLEQAKRLIKYANNIGMWTLCTFIIGFPNETRKQIEDTINFAINSDTDLAVFYLLCPHPGTPVYEEFRKNELINFDYIFKPTNIKSSDFTDIGRALAGRGANTKYFTAKELQQFIYLGSKRFFTARIKDFLMPLRIIKKIKSFEDLRYTIKMGWYGCKMIMRLIINKQFSSQALRRNIKN